MEIQKVYHLSIIFKPKFVIKDFHGRHTHNHSEAKFDVGVLGNFQELVNVCAKIDHTNVHFPKNIPSNFGFWGTSFDKRDRTSRDSLKMVTAEEALHIMMNGPKSTGGYVDEYEDEMDFVEAERREMNLLKREMEEDEYEDFLADIVYGKKSYSDAVY